MGKNVYTEIKCHSLLPLDDIVKMVVHRDTIPEVKNAYVNFLTHCYIDTEEHFDILPEATETEEDLLDMAPFLDTNSRYPPTVFLVCPQSYYTV